MFFKNRELRISAVKKTKKDGNDTPETMETCIGESSARIVKDLGKELLEKAAITAVVVIAAYKAIDTLSQIAVKKTKSADKED